MKYQTISMKRFFSYERRNLLCSHSNGDIFTCENNMLFSRVKISCFRAKAHLVFHWCLYNKLLSLFIPMAFHSKKKMLRELKIILRPFDKAYIKLFKKIIKWDSFVGNEYVPPSTITTVATEAETTVKANTTNLTSTVASTTVKRTPTAGNSSLKHKKKDSGLW